MNNSIRLERTEPLRGLIFDRHNRRLVENRPSFDLHINFKDAKPVRETVAALCQYLGEPFGPYLKRLDALYGASGVIRPALLKQDIGRNWLAVIEARKFDLPGIFSKVRIRRNYVNGFLSAHILGYIGEINSAELERSSAFGYEPGDLIGKYGVEKSFEPYLRGKNGGRQVEVNARGKIVQVLKTVPPIAGDNLYLTISGELQQKTEELLYGKTGAVVALDPNNGQILSMASSPAFDLNDFVTGLSREKWRRLISDSQKPLTNKAIQGEYPPASTYKIITAMAGLEERVVDRNTTFYCPGYYRYGDRVFRCWKKTGHGRMNLVKALAQSCDVYFYQVGQKLGVDRLAEYAKAGGLGERTGIHIDNEGKGLIPTVAWKKKVKGAPWHGGETLSIAIGQGYNLVTPLQMAVMIGAVANGGILYRPIIVDRIVSVEGEERLIGEKEIYGRLPVSPGNLSIIRKGLWEVVNGKRGTARAIRIDGVEISGKTGTAQVFSQKGNRSEKEKEVAEHLKPHAWFVAYAPSRHPKIAVSVIVEHGEHGSSAAAPIARDLIQYYLIDTPNASKTIAQNATDKTGNR